MTTQAISEKFSKKRGRPRIYNDAGKKDMGGLFNLLSDRAQRNRINGMRAYGVLKNAGREKFTYILGEYTKNITHQKMRKTILDMLGSIDDDDLLLFVAEKICENKTPTSLAVQNIRAVRGAR